MNRIILALFVTLAVLLSAALAKRYNCNMPNEEYQCGSACQTTCETLGETCPIVNIVCNNGCYCKNGFARDHRGICIPIKKCPPKKYKSPIPRPISITRFPLFRVPIERV